MRIDECITNPDFIRNPFPFYREIRETEPIHWSEKWRCWIVTDYENCATCLKNARQFSNCGRVTGLFNSIFDEGERERLRPLIEHYSEGLINIDPPDHTRLRKILQDVFRPSVIQNMAAEISEAVNGLLDSATKGSGRLEFISEFAHPLPVGVIARMFGVPESQTHLFTRWSAGIVLFMQSPQPSLDACLASQESLLEMRRFIRGEIERRRESATEDLLGRMVTAEVDGERLTDEEILSTSVTLLLGGHETTTRLLGNTLYDLIHHPEQMKYLREFPDAMKTSVEEFLRFSGPFHRDQRVASEDSDLGGKRIRRGDYLLLMLQSANRDPSAFDHPDRFDLRRNSRKHLGFGAGFHVCLGAHLARLETFIAFRTLLDRFGEIHLTVEPEWEYGFLRGPVTLNLDLST